MMKPIIWDINEMTDSTEVYESRPNPFLTGTIYLVLVILGIAFLWMYVAKIDIVVKGNGMFRGEENGVNVSAGISGKIKTCDVADGQYVEAGQTLMTLEVDSLDSSIESNKQELEEINKRIEMLQAYQNSLDDGDNELVGMEDNPYYNEFTNRKQLLETSIVANDENISGQKSQYNSSINNIEKSIADYEKKEKQLDKAIAGVKKQDNPFDKKESYYHSIVSSYISSYESTSLQYDNQIETLENSIAALTTQKNEIVATASVDVTTDSVVENDVVAQSANTIYSSEAAIDQQIKENKDNLESIKKEKKKALKSLELQQIATLEQEKASVQSAIMNLQENKTSTKVQMEALKGNDTTHSDEVSIMTEKNNVANELLTYQNKKKECEDNLNSLMVQNGNCQVQAMTSGYIMMENNLEEGQYVQQGMEICQILPEEHKGYYAEVYVENQDVGKLKEGQNVKFEIAAYPSSEYGYFTGRLESVSKDVKVDQNTGNSYYIAKVLCDKTTVSNKKGETASIQNGMACQAKVVVSAQRVSSYLLDKINLID